MIVLPVLFEGQVKAVIELASLREFTASHLAFLEQLTGSIGIVLNTIEATMRTEGLLKQSQQLAGELQTQQNELQQTNEELAQKAQLLAEQNAEVERKNQEIEQARRALEEKAAELALTSRYKSEFLANMSHELRTPLNSILILGQQLAENADEQPDAAPGRVRQDHPRRGHRPAEPDQRHPRPVEDRVGHGHGRVRGPAVRAPARDRRAQLPPRGGERASSTFSTDFDRELGRAITTDPKRLLQVLKNLLSNAFKFTEHGSVRLRASASRTSGWSADHPVLSQAQPVVSRSRSPTPASASRRRSRSIIFEAFQQADAGTARKYGGTGLGLAISRELADLLGGEIRLHSVAGQRQHVHAVPAARATSGPRLRPRQQRSRSAARRTPRRSSRSTLPAPRVEEVDDDRDATRSPATACC